MGRPRSNAFAALLISISCLCLISPSLSLSSHAAEPEERRAVFTTANLFAAGDVSFEDDFLSKLVQLSSQRSAKWKADRDHFVNAGTVAKYLGLQSVETMYVTVPVNFILVGFARDGNFNVELTEAEIRKWFEHIDHVVPHSRLPVPHGPEGPDREFVGDSSVSYNFSVHVMEAGSHVTEVIEDAIAALARPENPVHGGIPFALREGRFNFNQSETYSVDADVFADILHDFVRTGGFDEAYNFFILNPRKDTADKKLPAKYGYRSGLSKEEVNYLSRDEAFQKARGNPLRAPGKAVKPPAGWKPPRAEGRFSWTSLVWQADAWVDSTTALLVQQRSAVTGKPATAIAREYALQQLAARDRTTRLRLLRQLDRSKDGGSADCATDAVVSPYGVAWVDLSAGPFTWGPVVTSSQPRSGLRGNGSLPSVAAAFSALPAAAAPQSTRAELEAALEELADQRFAEMDAEDEVELIEAELDVYEMFAKAHCAGASLAQPMCEELRERVRGLEAQLDELSHQEGEARRVRPHEWNIFAGDPALAQDVSLARDRFLSELGALLAGAMHHVAAPTAAEGLFRHHTKVSVHLYMVTLHDGAEKPLPPFDVDGLEEALEHLILPSQALQFSTESVDVSEDPALSIAVAGAMRGAATAMVGPGGHLGSVVHRYLDARELSSQLRELNVRRAHRSAREVYTSSAAAAGDSVLDVPVFVFSSTGTQPLFLDEDLSVALSLPDMVIGVQSAPVAWPRAFLCDGEHVRWNLQDPLKAVVAAVAEHIGGALPMHRGRAPPHGDSQDDWLWGTGSHALSSSSLSARVSRFTSDAVHRNYVLSSLDASVDDYNDAVALLSTPTTVDLWESLSAAAGREIAEEASRLAEAWGAVAAAVGKLQFEKAVQRVPEIERSAKRVLTLAEGMAAGLHPAQCTRKRRVVVGWGPVLWVLLPVLLVGLCVRGVIASRKKKPKIN